MLRVAVGCDHAGYPLKESVIRHLEGLGCEVQDVGAFDYDRDDDYPDFARAVGEALQSGKVDRGILLCGSGVGASIAANKMVGVRACMCHDTYSARQGVEHDDMNVLCLGGRIIGVELVPLLVEAFIRAEFTKEKRHQRRLEKVHRIEITQLTAAGKEKCL
jgi:ribose 5-phosphate isomerase B